MTSDLYSNAYDLCYLAYHLAEVILCIV